MSRWMLARFYIGAESVDSVDEQRMTALGEMLYHNSEAPLAVVIAEALELHLANRAPLDDRIRSLIIDNCRAFVGSSLSGPPVKLLDGRLESAGALPLRRELKHLDDGWNLRPRILRGKHTPKRRGGKAAQSVLHDYVLTMTIGEAVEIERQVNGLKLRESVHLAEIGQRFANWPGRGGKPVSPRTVRRCYEEWRGSAAWAGKHLLARRGSDGAIYVRWEWGRLRGTRPAE